MDSQGAALNNDQEARLNDRAGLEDDQTGRAILEDHLEVSDVDRTALEASNIGGTALEASNTGSSNMWLTRECVAGREMGGVWQAKKKQYEIELWTGEE